MKRTETEEKDDSRHLSRDVDFLCGLTQPGVSIRDIVL